MGGGRREKGGRELEVWKWEKGRRGRERVRLVGRWEKGRRGGRELEVGRWEKGIRRGES